MISEEMIEESKKLDEKIYKLIQEMEEFDEMFSLIRLTQAYCVILDKINNSGEVGEELLARINKDVLAEHGYQVIPIDQMHKTQEKTSDPMFM